MDATLRDEWVTALESGEYTKSHFALHDQRGHCALGVLADILVKKGLLEEDENYVNGQGRFRLPGHRGSRAYIDSPEEVGAPGMWYQYQISVLNDAGVSFEEIAKVIRRDIPVDGNIGEPVKETEVVPLVEPDEVPAEPAVEPVREPEPVH